MNQNLTIFQRVLLHIFWVNFWVSERIRGGGVGVMWWKVGGQTLKTLLDHDEYVD